MYLILAASSAAGLKGGKPPVPAAGVRTAEAEGGVSFMFWLFVLAVFLYGYCETVFANWAIIYLGKEVALIEEQERLGGVCLREGCIPSKALITMVENLEYFLSSASITQADYSSTINQLRTDI